MVFEGLRGCGKGQPDSQFVLIMWVWDLGKEGMPN